MTESDWPVAILSFFSKPFFFSAIIAQRVNQTKREGEES